MSTKIEIQPRNERELVICRLIDAPVEKVYGAWTNPKQIPHWFVPKPWTITKVEMDIRPGGSSLVVMRSPEGQEFPNPGIYLEVVPNKKLVFTDAFINAWQPSEKPFMTAELTFEPAEGGKTKYTARAMHWTLEDTEQHKKMGFHEGWGTVVDQLEEFIKSL